MLWKKINSRAGRRLTSLWNEILQITALNLVVRIELTEKLTVEKLLEKSKGLLCRYLRLECCRQRTELK